MRSPSPVVLLLMALAGVLGGAALIGTLALGCAVIFDSLAVGAYGFLFLDLPEPKHAARPAAVVPLAEFLQRKAAENW